MTDDPPEPADDEWPAPDEGPRSQEIRHANVGARVPEHVGRGVFCTGVIVLQSTHEFVLDFLQRMIRPQQVTARVVLPPPVVGGFIRALRENLGNYERKFGPPHLPRMLVPPPSPSDEGGEGANGGSREAGDEVVSSEPSSPVLQPSAEDVYDDLKLPDAMLAGTYANAVMISHTPTEFCFDFLTTFFPRSAVSCRVFVAAPNVPSFLGSLEHSFEQYRNRQADGGPPEAGG